jgi:hypothetical protein
LRSPVFHRFLTDTSSKASMEVFTFVFLLFLGQISRGQNRRRHDGTRFRPKNSKDAARGKIAAAFRVHAVGFVRVMGNLGVLADVAGLAAYLMSHEAYFSDQYWVADAFAAKAACVGGVALGTTAWFCGLSFGISRTQGRIQRKNPAADAAFFRPVPDRAGNFRRHPHRVATAHHKL